MSGILDSKTRVLDTIITVEGRKQLAFGGIDISYVSFSDSATYYAADIVSGSADATLRLYLESCCLPQDQITFQADDLGRLLPYSTPDNNIVRSGQVINYSFDPSQTISLSGSRMQSTTLTGNDLIEVGTSILTSSIDNFVKHMSIGTHDPIFDDDGFAMSNNDIEFMISDERPIDKTYPGHTRNFSQLQDLFIDPRLSHLPNFMYLPPINKVDNSSNVDKGDYRQTSKFSLGNYQSFGLPHVNKIIAKDVINEHQRYDKLGYAKKINFEPTSRANNLFIQAFEVTNDAMFKMDIIDFGTWYTPPVESSILGTSEDPGPVCQIFFVGKLVTKPDTSTHAFVHLFTLIFGA